MIPIDHTLPTNAADAEAQGWLFFNEGACRTVWHHPSRPGVLLKIEDGASSSGEDNLSECQIWEEVADGPFAHLLTPVLARSPGRAYAILVRREVHITEGCSLLGHSPDAPARPWPYTYPSRAQRELMWEHGIADTHRWNMAGAMDDYGTLFPARILDYSR